MATRSERSDAHRDGHSKGINGKSEYGFFDFPSRDREVRDAHREGYNDGREKLAEAQVQQQSNKK